MISETLTTRDLNRALLARHGLLERESTPIVGIVERLAGMQAQEPWLPFVGLWSRLTSLDRAAVIEAVTDRALVRATAQRGTLHLLSADDYRRFRPTLQPALSRGFRSVAAKRAANIPVDAVAAATRAILAAGPLTFTQIRRALADRYPDIDHRVLGYCARMHVALIEVPGGSGAWGWPADPPFALADTWLGVAAEQPPDRRVLVRRYLAAYGPASARDVQVWSGLTGLGSVVDELREELVVFRGPDGSQLVDVPDAPRPGGAAAAPVRLLPGWDTTLLAHHDRQRIVPAAARPLVFTAGLRVQPTFLVDGFVAGTWRITRTSREATLTLTAHSALAAADHDALLAEADALLVFTDPSAASRRVITTVVPAC
jgi:hypothetical protein